MITAADQPDPSSSPQDGGWGSCDPQPSAAAEGDAGRAEQRWRLDPQRLPRRVELELSEPSLRRLRDLAERSGRDLEEIVLELLDQQLSSKPGGGDEPPLLS